MTRPFAKYHNNPRNTHLKKLLLASTLLAALSSSPAWAWNRINIFDRTDPVDILWVWWTARGIPAVAYFTDIRRFGEWRTVGPLPETGPCMRTLHVLVSEPTLGMAVAQAQTPMNVCTEGWVSVSGNWPTPTVGGSPLVIRHGFGGHP